MSDEWISKEIHKYKIKLFLIKFSYKWGHLIISIILCIIKSTLMTSFSEKSNINIIADSTLPKQYSLS